jgi:DNA-binding LacI/PurR family transcriptional regulator
MLGPPTTEPLLAGKVPVVVVGWHVDHPAVDVVRTSDERGMALAVDHLVSLGHRRITHIDGGDGPIATSRRAGYVVAMRAHGLEAEIRWVTGGQTQLDGQRAARLLLDEGQLPTAVVAFNDDVAVAAMALIAQRGVAVPGRLSMVGWDDSEAARLSPIGLTSIAQPVDEIANSVIRRIVARIEGRRVEDREVVLEPELQVRSSSESTLRMS